MKRVMLSLALVGFAAAASAQTVVNPGHATFIASADHATVVGGIPLVDHYDLQLVSTSGLAFTQGLAKPTPDANGIITVALSSGFIAAMVKNALYTATVAAVGPGGTAPSAASSPFVNLGRPAPATNVRLLP